MMTTPAKTDVTAAEHDAAVSTLAVLNAQADAVRIELARLQRRLAILHVQFGEDYIANLQQANEKLLVSALDANAIAALAKAALEDMLRTDQRDVPPAPFPPEPSQSPDADRQQAALREANERLVIASLTAHELKDLAEAAHGQQIKFMAMVAHELRNPLAPLKMAAGMLATANADAGRMAKLQGVIEDQVGHMARLVEDLLDGSRISTGKLRLQLGQVDLADILRASLDTCTGRAVEKSQQVRARLPDSGALISGDKVRLTQVFNNLLDNALKYTPAGGHIDVTLEIGARDAIVSIADDGAGIAANALLHIFDLFVQELRGLGPQNSGLGIGLAVVRELVDAHGGTVTAASAGRGQGTQFTVTLPLMDASTAKGSMAATDDAG
jgi:signal transduction histidine kinase